jgi:chemotaxis protein methyltransferase CheR
MERRISSLLYRSKAPSLQALYEQLKGDPARLKDFVCGLTINVSEFFRNPERFEVLEQQILPELLANFETIKVWSAGCSLGAELYSVGMLLEQLGALDRAELVGTDLDAKILQTAESGLFHDYEVRAVPSPLRVRYFEPAGALFRFKGEAVRARCRFEVRNLLEDAAEPDCHLVICRNVVIYFNEQGKRTLYEQVQRALVPGGMLFVGNTERIFNHRELGFTLASPFFYQKALS